MTDITESGRRILARKIKANQRTLTEIFAEATMILPRWRSGLDTSSREDFIKREFDALSEYLIQFFLTGNNAFISLFAGERIKAFYDPSLSPEEKQQKILAVCDEEIKGITKKVRQHLTTEEFNALLSVLAEAHAQVRPQAQNPRRILLVGDCLYLDIVSFITGPLNSMGLPCEFEYVTAKNPKEIIHQLGKIKNQTFDLIFVSLYSYEMLSAHQSIIHWRNGLTFQNRSEDFSIELIQQTDEVLGFIGGSFECPTYVHNYSGMLREESSLKRYVKLAITHRNRSATKRLLNKLLDATVKRINLTSFSQIHLLDEESVVRSAGEHAAGAYFYKTELQHPATLGQLLAATYIDIIYTHTLLVGRKMVVCDLDNTLWDGVIGEGKVNHFHQRQEILKRLREKGVVLSILSKNDPKNVHWNGGTLSHQDFVYESISWNPKIHGMKQIERDLNIKSKDFVFIDDRDDEREMMKDAFPGILSLDATDHAVWRRFELWQRALVPDQEMDRTLMYRQRDQRIAFLGDEEGSVAVDEELFKSLNLKAHLSAPSKAELKRVTELINRTNQFNLEGRRTTLQEVTRWHQSQDSVILTARTGDRFGDMGVSCVAVMTINGPQASLECFVLSCRVFGYGVERAVINRLKALAKRHGAHQMVGRYTQTPQNSPCKLFLSDSGFVLQPDGFWACDLSAPEQPDMAWLTVSHD